MRDVIFVINGWLSNSGLSGSEAMRGVQPAQCLNVKCQTYSDLDSDIKNTILVFIGDLAITYKLTKEKILDLQSRNNIIIQDTVDSLCCVTPWPEYHKFQGRSVLYSTTEKECMSVIDGIITPNSLVLENLKYIVKNNCHLETILHNWDTRFTYYNDKPTSFTSGYCGVTQGIPISLLYFKYKGQNTNTT